MKKVILITVLAFGMSMASKAQISLGVKGGLNFNQSSIDVAQSGSAQDVSDSRTGFHFGVYSVIKLGPIGIQPEVFYSAQGTDISFDGAKGAVKTGYVQVPVLVRFNFLKIFNIHAGPQFGFLLKEALDGDAKDALDSAVKNDISIAAGLGLDLPLGLTASIRYIKGLKDAYEFDTSGTVPGVSFGSSSNDMIQLSVGYTLLGK